MTLRPPSARPAFAGFAAHYDAEIAPFLRGSEARRLRAVFRFAAIVAATTFAATVLAMLPFAGFPNTHAAGLVAMGGAAAALFVLNRARDTITDGLLQRAAAGVGFAYRRTPPRPAACDLLRRLKLLEPFNQETWEDEVDGRYEGLSVRLTEANLKHVSGSGRNKRVRTVFHGQIVEIEHHVRFGGVTVLRRSRGVLNALNRPGEAFSRVGLASNAFEKAFDAWSTDQVEARTLLDPVVLERFLELERLYRGKKLRAVFAEGRLVVAVETGDRLGMGTMFAPLADPARVEAILAEFDAVFDLVDVALKPLDGRLDGAFSLAAVKAGAV